MEDSLTPGVLPVSLHFPPPPRRKRTLPRITISESGPTDPVRFVIGGSPVVPKRSVCALGCMDKDTKVRFASANGSSSTTTADLTNSANLLSPPPTSSATGYRPSGMRKCGRNEIGMSSTKRMSLCLPQESTRQLFIQLNELYLPTTVDGVMQWWETARWLKYEEDVEAGAERWGRPHVASLSFHSLIELRKCIEDGTVILDTKQTDMFNIARTVVATMVETNKLRHEDAEFVLRALLLPHSRVQDRKTDMDNLRRQTTYNSLEDYFYRQQSLLSPMPDVLLQRKRSLSVGGSLRQRDSRARFRSCVSKVISVNEAAHQFDRKQSVAWRKLSSVRLPQASQDSTVSEVVEEQNDTEECMMPLSPKEQQQYVVTYPVRLWKAIKRRCCSVGQGTPWKDRKTGQAVVLRPGTDMELLKRIPVDTEAGVVLVGAVDFLEKPVVSFVRLERAVKLPNVTEIPIPVRFVFVLLGPLTAGIDYHEIGRSISTLLSTKSFCGAAYSACEREDLLMAIHDFMDDSIVLPPGDWDQKSLLPYEQIKNKSMWLNQRRKMMTESQQELDETEPLTLFKHDTLARTGSLFGGFIHEARVRFPQYVSDLRDAVHIKCLTCIVFIFFACFFPALTFGNILEAGTGGILGVKETLISTSVGGILFALFSTQPMLLMGVCGPMLIYEQAIFKFCKSYMGKKLYKQAFLQVRVWTAGWALFFCLLCTCFEGSFLIRYLTRFSDDILAALVALIFISEAFIFLVNTYRENPLVEYSDYCVLINSSITTSLCPSEACVSNNKPNIAVLSIVLVFATFFLAVIFKGIRTSRFFGRQIRKAIGDFGLSLAIIVVVVFDVFLADNVTSKVDVGAGLFHYHQYIVTPWPVTTTSVPLFMGAAVAGLFLFLVLFTENQVTEMMLSKKECGMKKGTGYHWDLALSGALLFLCATLKLPWLCAAPVRSTAHMNSLTKYKLRAPGQPPVVDYVLEQRVTGFVLHLLIGLSLYAPQVLNMIPKAVLFGVFLYLGVMSLEGLQMLSRTILFFVPAKHHPSTVYCLRVRTRRMHAFTSLQLFLLTVVCSIKMIKPISFAFPIAIIGTVIIRHLLLPKIFNSCELTALDSEDDHIDEDADFYSFSRIPL